MGRAHRMETKDIIFVALTLVVVFCSCFFLGWFLGWFLQNP